MFTFLGSCCNHSKRRFTSRCARSSRLFQCRV